MATKSLPFFSVYDPKRPGLAPTEAAYIAGLLDGEGYFGLRRSASHRNGRDRLSYTPTVVLNMCEEKFLQDLVQCMPWNVTAILNKRKLQGRQSPSWRIAWNGTNCTSLCRVVQPYIRLKKEQVELLLMLAEAKRLARAAGMLQGVAYPKYIKDLEAWVRMKIRKLNERGQNNA